MNRRTFIITTRGMSEGGRKAPFKMKENWSTWVLLEMQGRMQELVLVGFGIDSKLHAPKPRRHG